MKLVFASQPWEDYLSWQADDPNALERLNGWWSRRITLQDRFVYRVAGAGEDQRLEIAQCRFHY